MTGPVFGELASIRSFSDVFPPYFDLRSQTAPPAHSWGAHDPRVDADQIPASLGSASEIAALFGPYAAQQLDLRIPRAGRSRTKEAGPIWQRRSAAGERSAKGILGKQTPAGLVSCVHHRRQ